MMVENALKHLLITIFKIHIQSSMARWFRCVSPEMKSQLNTVKRNNNEEKQKKERGEIMTNQNKTCCMFRHNWCVCVAGLCQKATMYVNGRI